MAKQKFNQDCIDALLEKMTHFDQDDVESYLRDVNAKAEEYKDLTGQAAISKAIKEVDKQTLADLFERNMVSARNAQKLTRMQQFIKTGKATLRSLMVRDRTGKNPHFNIESAQHAMQSKLYREFHDDLTNDELGFVMNPQNDLDIAKAIDGKSSTNMARRIADKHMKLVEKTKSEIVSSDALPLSHLNPGRQISVTHDRSKILSGGRSLVKAAMRQDKYSNSQAKDAWVSFIKSKLNVKETFKKTSAMGEDGNIIDGEVNTILNRTFDNIINDRSNIFTNSHVSNDTEAVKRRSRMFFQWKDTESWMDYNSKYGKGDYYSAVTGHIHSSANRIGSAQILGDNPSQMFLNLKVAQEASESKSALWHRNTEFMYKEVNGIDKTAVSPKLANFMSNIRTLSGMASLFKIAALSIPDAASAASFAQRYGYSYWSAWGEHLSHVFNLFPSDERKYVSSQFKLMLDSHMGYMGKFVDAHNTSAGVSKLSSAFYKKVGIHALDNGNKISTMNIMARHLANMSGHTLESMPKALRTHLDKFGITDSEWNVLRKKNKQGLFTLDNVDTLTNDEVKGLYDESNKHLPLYEVKNDLYRKVYAMFDVASENAVAQPGAFTRAMMMQGTSPGTVSGEAVRAVMQFKAFPYQFLDRVLIRGFMDADGPMAKTNFALSLMLGTLPLSVGANMFDYWTDGKSFPDITQMSFPEASKFLLEIIQPNIGLFYSAIDSKRENQDMLTTLMGSPSTKFLSNALAAVMGAGTGAVTFNKKQLQQAMKSAEKAATSIIPARHIPIITPFARQALGQKSYLQPGQKQLYGK